MKARKAVRGIFLSLATLGFCFPQVAFAADVAPTPAVIDVALADGGVLHGHVVDLQGSDLSNVPVTVTTQDRSIASATTAPDGSFTVQNLQGGVYQVSAGEGQGVYRLWSAGTAPPAAKNGAIVYSAPNGKNTGTIHNVGLFGGGGAKSFLANPIVIAGVVATAVAVPVALSNSSSASP